MLQMHCFLPISLFRHKEYVIEQNNKDVLFRHPVKGNDANLIVFEDNKVYPKIKKYTEAKSYTKKKIIRSNLTKSVLENGGRFIEENSKIESRK